MGVNARRKPRVAAAPARRGSKGNRGRPIGRLEYPSMKAPEWSSVAYGTFAWQVMKARPAIRTLLREASKYASTVPADVAQSDSSLDGESITVALIAAAGQNIRDDIAAVIRHNCAGAALQIAYSLFEDYVKTLGLTPGALIRTGAEICGEPFSRILWASRNAFAHGDEWRRQGSVHSLAKVSYAIIQAIGFADPPTVNAFDLYAVLSGGDEEAFVQRLLAAAKDVGDKTPAPMPDAASTKMLLSFVLGLLLILCAYLFRRAIAEEDTSKPPVPGALVFVYRLGPKAMAIPIAEGDIRNPTVIARAMREGAIERLSEPAARPFKEVTARMDAWFASVQVLLTSNVEDPSFHNDLVDLATRAEQLYGLFRKLPDPVSALMNERRATSFVEGQSIMAEILAAKGFTKLEFREVEVDVSTLGLGEHLPANTSSSDASESVVP